MMRKRDFSVVLGIGSSSAWKRREKSVSLKFPFKSTPIESIFNLILWKNFSLRRLDMNSRNLMMKLDYIAS